MSSHLGDSVIEGARRVLPARRCLGPECRRHFTATRRDAQYCSTPCRVRASRKRKKDGTSGPGALEFRLFQEVEADLEIDGMFIPVVLHDSSETEGRTNEEVHSQQKPAIELVLSGRCHVRLPNGFDAATLRSLLQVLKEEGLC